MVAKRHHNSGKQNRRKVWWTRNTGVLQLDMSGVNVAQTVLFDPLVFQPDPVAFRAEATDITIHTMRFNYNSTFQVVVGTGTSVTFDIYMGISKDDRNAPAPSPAFSAADDARRDWMDCWEDIVELPAVIPGHTQSSYTLNPCPGGNQRHVKTKRIMDAQEVVNVSGVAFPHTGGGTFPTIASLICQWQLSVLMSRRI